MTNKKGITLAASVAALAIAASANPAFGQTTPDTNTTQISEEIGLEEIVVTAQKRTERLQDTPISITAVTGETLADRGTGTIASLGTITPNLVYNTTAPVSGASSGAVVFIRGVGQTDFQLTTDPGVGTYLDGVYVARSVGGVLDVVDVERVEVLRGPQGTLFGRNTIGGAISIISRKPGTDRALSSALTLGSRNRVEVRVSADLPLADGVGFNVVGSVKRQDGYVRGLLDGRDLGDVNRQSVRTTLVYDREGPFRATLTADYTHVDEQNAASKLVGISSVPPGSPTRTDLVYNRRTGAVDTVNVAVPPGNPSLAWLYNNADVPVLSVTPFDARWITPDLNTTYANGPNGTRLNVWGAAGTLEYDFGGATIKSISAYRKTSGSFNRDADGSPTAVTHTENFDYRQEQFSQELQLTGQAFDRRLAYAAGLYYFDEKGNDLLNVTLPVAFGQVRNFTFVKNKSYAAYAQATFKITPTLGITGGVRYTKDKKGYFVPLGGGAITNGFAAIFGPAGTVTPFFAPGNYSRDFENTSFRAGVDWKPINDLLLYATYSEGFKSGGFNTRYLAPVPSAISYNPELLKSYEIGAKVELFDRRLRVNTAAFHSNYDDIQLTVYDQGAPITRNGGSARINGAEVEISAVPIEGLTLSGGIGYLDAKYTSVPALVATIPADQQIRLSTRLAKTPEWTTSARAEYRLPLTGDVEAVLSGDWFYTSSIENDAINSKFLSQPGYSLFNASLGFEFDGGRFSITGFVNNIANKRVIESGDSNYSIGFHEANFNRPREGGVTLKARF
ncbi:MAG: TonB-dependent receptor [Sphingomonadaceae bacterium]|nr:TonB-dependent receptor [Sphingomonadaceae bacterium]